MPCVGHVTRITVGRGEGATDRYGRRVAGRRQPRLVQSGFERLAALIAAELEVQRRPNNHAKTTRTRVVER